MKSISPDLAKLVPYLVLALVALLLFDITDKTSRSIPAELTVHSPHPSALASPVLISSASSNLQLAYGGISGMGYKNTYRMTMAGGTTVLSQGRSQVSTIRTEMVLTQTCVPQSADQLSLTTKIDAGSISVNGTLSPIPMIGQVVGTTMTRDGTIITNSGYQGLDLKSMQLVLPRGPVAKGYHWEVNLPPSSSVPIALTVQYRIVDVEEQRGEVRARISSRVRSIGDSNVEGLTIQIVADGTIWFSCTRGMIISNDVDSRTSMTLLRVVKSVQQETRTDMTMRMNLAILN